MDSCLEILDKALQLKETAIVSSVVVAAKGEMKRQDRVSSLMSKVENMFGIPDITTIDPNKRLSDLGMDSMLSFELKQILVAELNLPMTREKLRMLTVADLKAITEGTYQ